jgi:hypothetical protein
MTQQLQAAAVPLQQQQQHLRLPQQQQHSGYAAYHHQSMLAAAAAAAAVARGVDSTAIQMPIPLNEAQQAFAMQAYALQYAAHGYDYRHLSGVEQQQQQLQQLQLQPHAYAYTGVSAAAVPLVASSDAYALQGWHMPHAAMPHAVAYAYPYEHAAVPVVLSHPEAAWLQQQQHQQLLPHLYAEQLQAQAQQQQQQQHSAPRIVQPQPVQAAHVQLLADIVQDNEVVEEDLEDVEVDEVQENEVRLEASELSLSKPVKEELTPEERQERCVHALHTCLTLFVDYYMFMMCITVQHCYATAAYCYPSLCSA